MNVLALRKLAKNYMEVWSADSEGLLDIYADKALTVEYTHFGKRINGTEEYKAMLQTTYRLFPDIKVKVSEIIPGNKGNEITVFWHYTGTHESGTLFGVEATGKAVSVNGMTVLTIKNKHIIREKGIIDNLGLLMQLTKRD